MQVTEFLPFLLSGLIPWYLISAAIGEACITFLLGEGLMKSRQFPYTALIYGVLARNVIIFGHNLLGYIPIALLCGVALTWKSVLLIPGLMLVILNCTWMALLVAVFCLRFRDFSQLVTSLLQIAMFVTPVFWNASQLEGKRAVLVDINLLHHMVEVVRQPMLGKAAGLTSYVVCVGAAIGGWVVAYMLFARKRHRLAYWF
jgi:lipopolysaccharide transport system permease protein